MWILSLKHDSLLQDDTDAATHSLALEDAFPHRQRRIFRTMHLEEKPVRSQDPEGKDQKP